MDKLKALLGDDLFNQVVAKLGTDKTLTLHGATEKLIVDDGKLIPSYRLTQETDRAKALEGQLATMGEDLKAFKKAAEGKPELVTAMEKAQADLKTFQTEAAAKLVNNQKLFAVKECLMDAGVVDADARDTLASRPEFDLSKIELDDKGKVKGFADIVKPIKESKTLGLLFGETRMGNQQHSGSQDGGTPVPLTVLDTQLAQALKNGRPLHEIVYLRRQIAEAQAAQQ